jgi:hypothetical protein
MQKNEKAVIFPDLRYLKNTTSAPNYQIFDKCKIIKFFF